MIRHGGRSPRGDGRLHDLSRQYRHPLDQPGVYASNMRIKPDQDLAPVSICADTQAS